MSATKSKPGPASTVAPPAANTAKRDYLIQLEATAQKRWSDEKAFETDSPYTDGTLDVPEKDFAAAAAKAREERPKWMGTFPYPVSFRSVPCIALVLPFSVCCKDIFKTFEPNTDAWSLLRPRSDST